MIVDTWGLITPDKLAMMKCEDVSEKAMPVRAIRLERVATRPRTGSGIPSL